MISFLKKRRLDNILNHQKHLKYYHKLLINNNFKVLNVKHQTIFEKIVLRKKHYTFLIKYINKNGYYITITHHHLIVEYGTIIKKYSTKKSFKGAFKKMLENTKNFNILFK